MLAEGDPSLHITSQVSLNKEQSLVRNTAVVGLHCTAWQQGEMVQLLGISLRQWDRAWGEAPFLPFGPWDSPGTQQRSCGPYNAVNKGDWWKRWYNFLWKNVWKDFAFVTGNEQQQKNHHLGEKQVYLWKRLQSQICSIQFLLSNEFIAYSFCC